MTFDFPIRARCIEPNSFFHRGEEVTVLRMLGHDQIVIAPRFITKASRFKPVVRVKAKCQPSIDLTLKRAVDALRRMTPQQRSEMWRKQRESYVRGEMGLDR